MKIIGRITIIAKKALQQFDRDHLVYWSNNWQMVYNLYKRRVLHIWSDNSSSNYSVNGIEITKVNEEKDLEVIIISDLKPGKHCSQVIKTVNK